MKQSIIAVILAAGLVMAGSGSASASNVRDCVLEKAGNQLTEGQVALVSAHGDGEFNILSTAQGNDLDLSDVVRVHGFMWSAGIACLMGK